MTPIEGALDSRSVRCAVVVARFNSLVTDRLLEGALEAIRRTGGDPAAARIVRVPGAWEIPLAVRALGATGQVDAIICLGAVIRGETPHFEVVASESARGMAESAMALGIPVANGVLTADTMEQALDRAGGKAGNKGFDAALAAMEMVHVLRQIRS